MIGPGSYNHLAEKLKEETQAEGVVLLIANGNQGNGFAVYAPPSVLIELPDLLRRAAEEIERDIVRLSARIAEDN